ncbi:hypothetical protein COV82_02215 [Candidatus Peregrinibacteria bacterium CG11_big_fil_rev_8_21_14_0_20_46_8]|nr:MAG: hypothetical protein COV82_02215 [Candidatus Peregrinibacteria bacterium CG11_big_fil_rev_8_21_14_0_20_46_8]
MPQKKKKANDTKKSIVVLGAGFAGLQVVRELSDRLKKTHDIILIDENDVHIYTPDLYEIATAYNEKINPVCLTKLKDTVATPIASLINKRRVTFIKARVSKIDPHKKQLTLSHHGEIEYDYLVVALGSVTNYYNIPGLEEHSLPLKTMADSLAINCHLDYHFHKLWEEKKKRTSVDIIIGGGGFTGVEFASELPGCIKKICKKFNYPRSAVHITIIEGGEYFLGDDKKLSKLVSRRLYECGIIVRLQSYITKVTDEYVYVKHGGKEQLLPADMVFWTGGVKPNPLVAQSFEEVNKRGALQVNEFLQLSRHPEVFAGGDNAEIIDYATGKPVPMLAQLAFEQGKLIARNIATAIENENLKRYRPKYRGFIVPLGGKYAIWKTNSHIFKGRWCWYLRRLVDLKYALSILPFWYALKKWLHDTNVFVGND